MGVTINVIVGVTLDKLVDQEVKTFKKTQYDRDTGKPYEINQQTIKYYVKGTKDELPNKVSEIKLKKLGLNNDLRIFCHNYYTDPKYVLVGDCIKTGYSSGIMEIPNYEEEIKSVRESLQKAGYDCVPQVYVMTEVDDDY